MSNRIKLALVSETTVGGVRKHISIIAGHIDREQFDVTVITSERRKGHTEETGIQQEFRALGVRHEVVSMVRELSPFQDFHASKNLQNIFRREQFDVVHAHGSKGGFLSRYACKQIRIPCCYSPHVFAFQRASAPKAFLYRSAEKLAAPWTRFFVVGSEQERRCAQSFGVPDDRIRVIPNSLPQFPNLQNNSRNQIRAALNSDHNEIVFLMAGRLVRYKGNKLALKAFSNVIRNCPNARLWIAGEGEGAGNLQRLAQKLGVQQMVHFLGFRKDLQELMSACDCFLLPSQVEGSPYTILEALALEKPIIATAVPGTQDVLSRLHCARLVPWNDVKALSEVMTNFVQTPISGCSRESLPKEWFDPQSQLRHLEDVYRNAVLT